jgi:hypothetical protein
MLEILDESHGNTLGLRLSGGVNEDDFITLLPPLQAIVEGYGFANLLIEISDVIRWGGYASGSREAGVDRMSDIVLGRVAIVGDKSWQAWLVKFLDPFTSSEERFFYPDQRQEAWSWVRSGMLTPE